MLFRRQASHPSVDFRAVADELVAALPVEEALRRWGGRAQVMQDAGAVLWARASAQQRVLLEWELRVAWWQPLVQLERARRALA
jgi:hypothetical protein